jgi:predicted homoserine dehydrogenase-like protein
MVENCLDNQDHPGLPICLAEGVTLGRDVRRDEKIYMDDVAYDQHRPDFALFAKALAISGETRR